MSATAQIPKPEAQSYLVRVSKDKTIWFAPIAKTPSARSYHLIETCTSYKYSVKQGKFIEAFASAILFMKHGENRQKLEGFKATTHSKLLEKIAKRLAEHYLHIQLEDPEKR